MALLKEEKAELIKKFQNDSSDTGSSPGSNRSFN